MKKFVILLIFVVMSVLIYSFYFKDIEGNKFVTEDYKKSNKYINSIYYSNEYFKENLLNEEDYYIYESIIKNNIEGITEPKIKCYDNCIDKMNKAINAIYLDHPELLSFKGMGSYKYQSGYLEYNNYYNFSKIKSNLATRRIERIMEKIREDTKNMSEEEKIIYVYNYVASHNYDKLFTYSSSNQSAYSFFTGGKSVCAGFAKAAQMIFQNIGVNSYLVLTSNHMFNYVEYAGKYYVFDATYGTSFRDKTDYRYYDGLGTTTTGVVVGLYSDLYPEIENDKLKDIFDL